MIHLCLQGVAALVATIAFAVLFHVPAQHYLCCGVSGAVGWVTYTWLVGQGYTPVVATFCGTFLLAVISYLFSMFFRAPTSVFLVCGIFPLVPGAGIYYTIYYFVMGENALCLAKGIETIKSATVIALGIAFALPATAAVARYVRAHLRTF